MAVYVVFLHLEQKVWGDDLVAQGFSCALEHLVVLLFEGKPDYDECDDA